MNFSWIISVACVFSAIASVQGAAFNVTVGKDGNLAFDPPYITGYAAGDSIIFSVYQASPPYGISESSFDQPCISKAGGQVISDPSDEPIHDIPTTVDISAGQPKWFAVSNANRCSSGMVFAVNPTTQQTYDAFKAKATGVPSASTPSTGSSSSSAPSASSSGKSTSASVKALCTSIQKIAFSLAGVNLLIGLFV